MALVLYAAGSAANHSYDVRSTGQTRVEMVETTTGTLADPMTIVQTLTLKGPGLKGNDRYNVSIRRNVTDTATSEPYTGSISAQISIPRTSAWTANLSKDLMSEMASFLGACKAYGASGTVVSGCTDTSNFPTSIAAGLFVGL